MKDRCIILDGVKDHFIPHLSRKNASRDMWEALKGLFQSKNENCKMVLREAQRYKDDRIRHGDNLSHP
jgi:hypothetical protein